MYVLDSVETLEAHYGIPGEASLIKETQTITANYRKIIERARFCALATAGPQGLDCSPRGDDNPVVTIEDDRTLLLPDWHGNNRIDTLRNIVEDPRVSLMFMVPGWNNVLRINGKAILSVAPSLLDRFEKRGKKPRSVVKITTDAIYYQCARAVIRAELWNADEQIGKDELPTPGEIMQEIKTSFDGNTYDAKWPERAAKSMW